MSHLSALTLLLLAIVGASPVPRCQEDLAPERAFHDPLVALAEATDDVGRTLLAAHERHDVTGLAKAIAGIEQRLGKQEQLADDRYVLAQGFVQLAIMRRFYEKQAPDDMPAVLEAMDPDEIAEAGIAHARAYAETHSENADIVRLHGELVSMQIRGMISGMTKGPEAKRLIEKAGVMDPSNGLVLFNKARMHYHNPTFAGGDKDLALEELRELQQSLDSFRVRLYLALTYNAKEMYPQARYWALKAEALAPGNPELTGIMGEIEARAAEAKPS